jgi:hypothetical protein
MLLVYAGADGLSGWYKGLSPSLMAANPEPQAAGEPATITPESHTLALYSARTRRNLSLFFGSGRHGSEREVSGSLF